MGEKSDESSEDKPKPVIVKNCTDLQRLKLEKLMKNPNKPILIPERAKEKGVPIVPDFVRNVMGSSAGAGSGEFHVYRHLRRKEYARQKYMKEKAEREKLDEEHRTKLEENKKRAEERTAKKRAKRLKKKQKNKQKKPKSEKHSESEESEQSDSENESSNQADNEDSEITNRNDNSDQFSHINSQPKCESKDPDNTNKDRLQDNGHVLDCQDSMGDDEQIKQEAGNEKGEEQDSDDQPKNCS